MLNNMLQTSQSSASQREPPAKRPASPLPDVQDWLELCLRSFGEDRGLTEDVVTATIATLDEVGYTPKELGDDRLNIGRIHELTRLPEGVILGMRNFAREWVQRQSAKRARFD